MARIRTIKPEFWSHPVMARLDDQVQLLALALLNLADDEGYFLADPALIRSFARPFDEDSGKTTGALRELSGAEWIELFETEHHGVIGRITHFVDHQAISHPKASKIKGYASVKITGTFPEGSGQERKGKEQGKEGSEPSAPVAEETPEGLHPMQYATRLLQEIHFPETRQNQECVRAAIVAIQGEGKSLASAYEFLLSLALDAIEEGGKVDKFWFEDRKWANGKRRPRDVAIHAGSEDTPEEIAWRDKYLANEKTRLEKKKGASM